MNHDFLVALVLSWMGVGGVASWFAKRYGWSEWKWFIASLTTGPVSWVILYLKIRDVKERAGPGKIRPAVPTDLDSI